MAKKINLNDYLGHSMDCTCGKEHKTNLKIVDIDKDAGWCGGTNDRQGGSFGDSI